jgi:hypothetical protein
MPAVSSPTKSEVSYWEARAWKHTGLGFFKCTRTGIRGKIVRYKDGTTGMMWAPRKNEGGGCIIKHLEREKAARQ